MDYGVELDGLGNDTNAFNEKKLRLFPFMTMREAAYLLYARIGCT